MILISASLNQAALQRVDTGTVGGGSGFPGGVTYDAIRGYWQINDDEIADDLLTAVFIYTFGQEIEHRLVLMRPVLPDGPAFSLASTRTLLRIRESPPKHQVIELIVNDVAAVWRRIAEERRHDHAALLARLAAITAPGCGIDGGRSPP